MSEYIAYKNTDRQVSPAGPSACQETSTRFSKMQAFFREDVRGGTLRDFFVRGYLSRSWIRVHSRSNSGVL